MTKDPSIWYLRNGLSCMLVGFCLNSVPMSRSIGYGAGVKRQCQWFSHSSEFFCWRGDKIVGQMAVYMVVLVNMQWCRHNMNSCVADYQ